jgi:hypothetical protein
MFVRVLYSHNFQIVNFFMIFDKVEVQFRIRIRTHNPELRIRIPFSSEFWIRILLHWQKVSDPVSDPNLNVHFVTKSIRGLKKHTETFQIKF